MAIHIDGPPRRVPISVPSTVPPAMRVFERLHRYALTGEGDLKTLRGKHAGKLRLGDCRVFFRSDGQILRSLAVKNRKQAYR